MRLSEKRFYIEKNGITYNFDKLDIVWLARTQFKKVISDGFTKEEEDFFIKELESIKEKYVESSIDNIDNFTSDAISTVKFKNGEVKQYSIKIKGDDNNTSATIRDITDEVNKYSLNRIDSMEESLKTICDRLSDSHK